MKKTDELAAIAARAAIINRKPIVLRVARKMAGGFEEKALTQVLALVGEAGLAQKLLQESKQRTGTPRLTFALLQETLDLPVVIRSSRLRFDFDGVFMQLMNDFADTPMWSAWQDAIASLDPDESRPLALVFSWPRLRQCKKFCVLHNAPTYAWTGTRLQRLIGESVFSIETLPSFLGGLGLLVTDEKDSDDSTAAADTDGDTR